MDKRMAGLVLFWIGVICAVAMGVFASFDVNSTFRDSTIEEVSQTIWSIPGFFFSSWAFSVPFGALLAGIGILIYSGRQKSVVWIFGLGILMMQVAVGFLLSGIAHIPLLFGIGGALLTLFFFGYYGSWPRAIRTWLVRQEWLLIFNWQVMCF